MRIAMVAEPREAHAVRVADLAAALTARGHRVTVYCRQDDPAAPDKVAAGRGYEVVRVPAGPARVLTSGDVVGQAPALRRALDGVWTHDRPDVVHTHSWTTAAAALAAAARHGIPAVHTFRPLGQPADHRAEVQHVFTDATSLVTVTCTAHMDELRGIGVPRSHILVVPDGVDIGHFTPDGPSAPARMRYRLVALGDSTPHAGVSTAIAALRALPYTELVVLGPPVDALRRYAGRLEVAHRLLFTGQVPPDELPALLRSADIVVCTPWHEPCHGAVLEAMACGAAVVATTVGPLSDIVIDKVTGLLVPPHRPRSLADALHRLLAQPVTREQFGAAGRDRANVRYAWQRIAGEVVDVYERAGALVPL
jgi:glycosyltransferase involved in cell wall biosynthesis